MFAGNIKFSIIICVYNQDQYLEECIKSVQQQLFRNYEIIIIDDGSTDHSGEICDDFALKDERLRVYHQSNVGLSQSRINGLCYSTGNYIVFLDSDDWIDNDYLATSFNALKQNQYDVVIKGMKSNGKKEKTICSIMPPREMKKKEAIDEMFQWNIFRWELCGKIYRKDLLTNQDFNTDILIEEDLWANWNIFNKIDNAYYDPTSFYHYRINRYSSTRMYNRCIGKTSDDVIKVNYHILIEDKCKLQSAWDNIGKNLIRRILKKIRYNIIVSNDDADGRQYQHIIREIISLGYVNKYIDNTFIDSCIIDDYDHLKNSIYERFVDGYVNIIKQTKNDCRPIFIYGTGEVSRSIREVLEGLNMTWDAYIETQPIDKQFTDGRKIYSVNEAVTEFKDALCILALNLYNSKCVNELLNNMNVNWTVINPDILVFFEADEF